MLSVEELHRLFRYDPDTGQVWWRVDVAAHVKAGSLVASKDTRGYLRVKYLGKSYKLHNVIWAMQTGAWPEPGTVDHKNRDNSNNSWNNLRESDASRQQRNRVLKNASGFRGVRREPGKNKYRSEMRLNGRSVTLGHFDTAVEAAKVYDTAVLKHHGNTAITNLSLGLLS